MSSSGLIAVLIILLSQPDLSSTRSFSINYDKGEFVKDGSAFRIISGSIHYNRVPAALWGDRFQKAYAAGFNAIQTYIAWHMHNPEPGVYDFSGQLNITDYLLQIQKHGLLALVRVGPYIDNEVDYGGFPWWLLKTTEKFTVRTSDPYYLAAVDKWLSVLLKMLKPLMYVNGGPILMFQMENEYGSYFRCDQDYMSHLYYRFRSELGPDAIIYTTDGGMQIFQNCISPLAYPTVDFGPQSNVSKAFALQKKTNKGGPLMNSEYYPGHLDYWGTRHWTYSTESVVRTLHQILAAGASVNMYMLIGGTTFGYWQGADAAGNGLNYRPGTTSYDFDAPITEAGDITEKYLAVRETIGKYSTLPDVPIPKNSTKRAYGKVHMQLVGTLNSLRSLITRDVTVSKYPLPFEHLNQGYGYVWYETQLPRPLDHVVLSGSGVHDYGVVMNETHTLGSVYRSGVKSVNVTSSAVLSVLAENMGRICYGTAMNSNYKGIIRNITLGGEILTNWKMSTLNLSAATQLLQPARRPLDIGREAGSTLPSMFEGSFTVDVVADTFLLTTGWGKGHAFINGFNVGRYWPTKGPQMTLYVPRTLLRTGVNSLSLFEIENTSCHVTGCSISFVDKPLLNGNVTSS